MWAWNSLFPTPVISLVALLSPLSPYGTTVWKCSAQPLVVNWLCHTFITALLALKSSILLVPQFGVRCLTICIIQLCDKSTFDVIWSCPCLVFMLCRQRDVGVFFYVFAVYDLFDLLSRVLQSKVINSDIKDWYSPTRHALLVSSWLPVEQRIKFKLATTHALHSANTNLLPVPRVCTIFVSRGFNVAARAVQN